MEYIGPQVWPGGWKVVSKEEADLLTSLGVDVRAWFTDQLLDGKLKLWGAEAPWRYNCNRRAVRYDTCFFVRNADGQTAVD